MPCITSVIPHLVRHPTVRHLPAQAIRILHQSLDPKHRKRIIWFNWEHKWKWATYDHLVQYLHKYSTCKRSHKSSLQRKTRLLYSGFYNKWVTLNLIIRLISILLRRKYRFSPHMWNCLMIFSKYHNYEKYSKRYAVE